MGRISVRGITQPVPTVKVNCSLDIYGIILIHWSGRKNRNKLFWRKSLRVALKKRRLRSITLGQHRWHVAELVQRLPVKEMIVGSTPTVPASGGGRGWIYRLVLKTSAGFPSCTFEPYRLRQITKKQTIHNVEGQL